MTIWEQAYLAGVIGSFVAVGVVLAYYAWLQAAFDRKQSLRQHVRLPVKSASRSPWTTTPVDRGL